MRWSTILTPAQLEAQWSICAQVDPLFAQRSRLEWEALTCAELRSRQTAAWYANDVDTYQKASSYLAIKEAV